MSKKNQQKKSAENIIENSIDSSAENLSSGEIVDSATASAEIKSEPAITTDESAVTSKKSKKEMLTEMVQKGKAAGKNVKTKVKAKVKKVAENKVIAEQIKKITPENEGERRRMKGIFLVLVGLAALVFISAFVVYKIFRPQAIAELVPAETTIGLVEVNTDGSSNQMQQFFQLLRNHPVYQQDQLIGLFNLLLPFQYQSELASWFGRKAGVALLDSSSQKGALTPVLLIETKDRQKALDFFRSRVLKNSNDELITENYNGFDLYTYSLSQPYSFFFVNQYVVIAGNRAVLKELADTYKNSKMLLTDEQNYRKIANNLPQNGLVSGYINIPKFFDSLAKNSAYTTREARMVVTLQPFLQLFSAKGFNLNAGEKNLRLQIFTSLDKKALNGATYLSYSDKYQGKLLELADPDLLAFAGGHDLTKELNRLDEIFTAGTKTSSLLFQGILEAQKQKYLGKDISLNNDVYPLLKGEYLATISGDLNKPGLALILELKDKNSDSLHFEKIVNAFIKTSAVFEPKIQDVTLPDGTKGQEVVASPEQVTRSDEVYEEVNITSLQVGNTGWSFHYAISGNKLLINTSKDGLFRMIDRNIGKNNTSLKNSDLYRQQVQPIFGSADEVMYTKIQVLLGKFGETFGLKKDDFAKIITPYLAPWNSVSTTKNFFDDGISELFMVDITQ